MFQRLALDKNQLAMISDTSKPDSIGFLNVPLSQITSGQIHTLLNIK
jgi:hypothetical protein